MAIAVHRKSITKDYDVPDSDLSYLHVTKHCCLNSKWKQFE